MLLSDILPLSTYIVPKNFNKNGLNHSYHLNSICKIKCKIGSYRNDTDEESCLVRCDAVSIGKQSPTFWRIFLPHSSCLSNQGRENYFYSPDGINGFRRNLRKSLSKDICSHSRSLQHTGYNTFLQLIMTSRDYN